MSYDIRVSHESRPWALCDSILDVGQVVALVNHYPEFVERGIIWRANEWIAFDSAGGLAIHLENQAPAELPDGSFDYAHGSCGAVCICASLHGPQDQATARRFAVYLGRELGAHAWDLQSEEDLATACEDRGIGINRSH